MIIVLGHVRIDPSDAEAFCRDIREIDPSNKPNSGCLFYSVAAVDPSIGRMLVAERWRDQQSLTAHLQRPETLAFVQAWSGRMQGDVRRYDASNERPLSD